MLIIGLPPPASIDAENTEYSMPDPVTFLALWVLENYRNGHANLHFPLTIKWTHQVRRYVDPPLYYNAPRLCFSIVAVWPWWSIAGYTREILRDKGKWQLVIARWSFIMTLHELDPFFVRNNSTNKIQAAMLYRSPGIALRPRPFSQSCEHGDCLALCST